jgi:hypothetical protein
VSDLDRMEENDWGKKPHPPKSVRTPPKEDCLDYLFKRVAIVVTVVTMATMAACDRRDPKPGQDPGRPKCVDVQPRDVARRAPCPSEWK